MLCCVYHPVDGMQVVEEDEAVKLRASGFWFDSPADAKAYCTKVEKEIKAERTQKPKKKGEKE